MSQARYPLARRMKQVRQKKDKQVMEAEILEDDSDLQPSTDVQGVVPAAASLLESLAQPAARMGKKNAARKLKKGAKVLRESSDQITGFVGGLAAIVGAFQKKEKA